MEKLKKITVFGAIWIALAQSTLTLGAGVNHSGGGDAIVCPVEKPIPAQAAAGKKKFWIFGKSKPALPTQTSDAVFFADTMERVRERRRFFVDLTRGFSESDLIKALIEFDKIDLVASDPHHQSRVLEEALKLGQPDSLLKFEFVSHSLPNVPDDFIIGDALPAGCRVEQLAIQDYATGVVTIDRRLYDQLTAHEKTALRIHEFKLKIDGNRGTWDSKPDSSYLRYEVSQISKSGIYPGATEKLTELLIAMIHYQMKFPLANSRSWLKSLATLLNQETKDSILEEISHFRTQSPEIARVAIAAGANPNKVLLQWTSELDIEFKTELFRSPKFQPDFCDDFNGIDYMYESYLNTMGEICASPSWISETKVWLEQALIRSPKKLISLYIAQNACEKSYQKFLAYPQGYTTDLTPYFKASIEFLSSTRDTLAKRGVDVGTNAYSVRCREDRLSQN